MADTFLVTGGAGFIGSNLVDLISSDNHIIVVDDLSTGKLDNLAESIKKIEFIEAKIESLDLDKVGHIDGIIHLAAQASVPLSIADFKNSSFSNMQGSINVIDYCGRNKIPLVYASSSAIYGNLPLGNDETNDIDLLSPYAADKYAMEVYAKTAQKVYGLSSVGLRFFNVYGPRQDPGSPYSGVISIFVDRLFKNQPITINGGYQTRDFIYVHDVVKCIAAALNLARNHSVCETLNILTGRSVTIDDLCEMVAYEIGVSPEKNYQELPASDPEVSRGTSEKLIRTLPVNISTFTDIDKGLKETIQFIKDVDISG